MKNIAVRGAFLWVIFDTNWLIIARNLSKILQPDSTKSKITTQSKLCTSGGLPKFCSSVHHIHHMWFYFTSVFCRSTLYLFAVYLRLYRTIFWLLGSTVAKEFFFQFLWFMHKHYLTQLSGKKLQNCWQIYYYFNAAPKFIYFLQTKKRKILQSTDITEGKITGRT